MSVAGIDYGNLSLLIAQAGKGGVDVILNDSSNRQTATAVSIQGKQRFIGDSGAAMARSNITNTIQGMKLLVGRRFDDPDVQKEMAKQPYKTVRMPYGGVGVQITYNDEQLVVPIEHFMAMMLVKGKEISANASGGINLADAVLAVPNWYTDAQRRGILQACEIAQVNCLKVANECNAIALSYGIFKSAKKLFSETEPMHVMFVDIGYTGYAVTVVDFLQENMRVLSSVCSREVSGRAFDDLIIEFMAEVFQKKAGIDVRNNKKAVLKLQAAAEKAKKTLSPAGVNEASISVECLAEDIDLNCILTREEFEARAAPVVQKLREPIEQALKEAGLTREQLAETEVVGGSSRVNIVKKVLGEILGLDSSALNYGLKTTMNADEAVARGGALQCAMLSSRMKVKPFNILDRIYYGIEVSFEKGDVSNGEEGEEKEVSKGDSKVPLYARGDELPHKPRRITFRNKTADFSLSAQYDEASASLLPPGESRGLGKFTVRVPPNTSPSDVRVTFNVDKHGLLVVQSAQLMEEVREGEGKEGETKGEEKGEGKEGEGEKKKRYRKVDLDVVHEHFNLPLEVVKQSLELEASMQLEDKLLIETADKRNELESYIYAMREKIDKALKDYATKEEKEKMKGELDRGEDWLYNEGFDTTKAEYVKKINELRSIGDKIEFRLNEFLNRPAALEGLKRQIELCKAFSANYDDAHAHITEEERERVRKEVNTVEGWMYEMQGKQGEKAMSADPVLTCEQISMKRKSLFTATNPIMIKPKPAPAPAPVPPPAPKDEGKEGEKKEGKEDGEGVPMDQAKGGPEQDAQENK